MSTCHIVMYEDTINHLSIIILVKFCKYFYIEPINHFSYYKIELFSIQFNFLNRFKIM